MQDVIAVNQRDSAAGAAGNRLFTVCSTDIYTLKGSSRCWRAPLSLGSTFPGLCNVCSLIWKGGWSPALRISHGFTSWRKLAVESPAFCSQVKEWTYNSSALLIFTQNVCFTQGFRGHRSGELVCWRAKGVDNRPDWEETSKCAGGVRLFLGRIFC